MQDRGTINHILTTHHHIILTITHNGLWYQSERRREIEREEKWDCIVRLMVSIVVLVLTFAVGHHIMTSGGILIYLEDVRSPRSSSSKDTALVILQIMLDQIFKLLSRSFRALLAWLTVPLSSYAIIGETYYTTSRSLSVLPALLNLQFFNVQTRDTISLFG